MKNLLFAPPALGTALSLTGLPGGSHKIQDRSSYGNIGTITGASWVKLPSGLWCLDFDGQDDHIDCGNNPSLYFDASGQMTLLAWVRRNMAGANHEVMSRRNSANGYMWVIDDANRLRFTRAWADFVSSDTVFQAGKWYHIALVYNNNNAQNYVNGVADGSAGTGMGYTDETAANLRIGYPYGWGRFNGKIALPRIYNRAATAFDIQNSYNREKHLFGVW
jgi:hypothetical protein